MFEVAGADRRDDVCSVHASMQHDGHNRIPRKTRIWVLGIGERNNTREDGGAEDGVFTRVRARAMPSAMAGNIAAEDLENAARKYG